MPFSRFSEIVFIAVIFSFKSFIAQGQTYADSLELYRERHLQKLKITGVLKTDKEVEHLNYYEADKKFIVEATLEKRAKIEETSVNNVYIGPGWMPVNTAPSSFGKTDNRITELRILTKDVKPYAASGVLSFYIDNKKHVLVFYRPLVVTADNKDDIIIPFADKSNEKHTYVKGRYLSLKISDISSEGKITIDFNKAYNPACAYDKSTNCLMPYHSGTVMANELFISIPAGEKKFY